MKFDIKDIKTWANRHDVKAGDVGYVTCDFNTFLLTTKVALVTKATVKDIDDNDSRCFVAQPLDGKVVFHYGFFLPVDAVKEDKPKKKYRPIKSLVELSIAIYGELNHFKTVCMGNDLFIRLKGCKNYERVLITHLEFDNNHALVAINGNTLKTLFENYELRNDKGEYVPFGVEVEDEYSSF